MLNTTPSAILDGDNSSLQGTDKTDETKPNNNESLGIIPDASVIWGDANNKVQDMGYTEWKDKRITASLYDVLSNEKNNSLFAISVGFELRDEFVYNGKSIAAYAAEADNERLRCDKLGQLLKLGDSLKYGEALYKTGTPTGENWTKELYEETVETTIGRDLIAKYIVDGELLKEKLESDIANYYESEPCRIAYEVACEAYYQFVIDAAIEQLEEQNIKYEIRNENKVMYF